MQPILDWLTSLPPATLYLVLGLAAAVENIFPPFPADTVVAFGSFLAARGNGSAVGSFLSTWIGNVTGAMAMYALGRRYGAEAVEKRFTRKGRGDAERRFKDLYQRYGLVAIFLTRFLPGVRAIVPPLAGAFRIPAWGTAFMVALASAIWYSVVTYFGYQVGSSWEELLATLKTSQRVIAIVAGAIAVLGGVLWLALRRRKPA